jgi:hypothetical protein
MPATDLTGYLTFVMPSRGQELSGLQALGPMLDAGLEAAVLLFSFTLAICVVLVFIIRALMILRKLPVPLDPLDMAKPKGFRAMMLVFSALLAPLVASSFLPETGLESQSALLVAYLLEMAIAVLLWFVFEIFYRIRDRRSGHKA